MFNPLIITYYWPPSGGSGVQRWVYFSKYLKKMGCNPIVLSVNPKYASYGVSDSTLLEHVNNIETYRTSSLEILKFYSFLKSGNKVNSIPQSYIPDNSFFDKLASFVRLNFFIPDSRLGWNYFAFKKAKEIIKNNKIDCIITTGPPHSSHLIGYNIIKKFKLKWIVDLRDPWSEIFYLKNKFRFNISKKINSKLELKVLDNCDAIITTVGERYNDILSKKITSPKKIYNIYNGYDKLNYDQIEEKKPKKFNIVFTGVLSQNHCYHIFDKILLILKEKYKNLDIILTTAGNIDLKIKSLFSNKIKHIDLGYVNHDEAIEIIKSSHLLINFNYLDTEETDMVSGKLIEYLASGSPIINFSNNAIESEILLNKSEDSFNANDGDIDKVVKFIISKYSEWSKGNFIKKVPEDIHTLSRENLTKRLFELIVNTI
tara:strand:- start:25387 stop:26673 length:1287 start_codon:yes stop_codon:yes gene_type:complete